MKNKDYTPDISEFHVGFEYEEINITYHDYNISDENWYYMACYANDMDIEDIDNQLNCGNIRVKYLDKKDIEELGWKKDSYNAIINTFTKDKYVLELNSNNRIIIIDNQFGEEIHFNGYIKNKSELKKIMKMIGICG